MEKDPLSVLVDNSVLSKGKKLWCNMLLSPDLITITTLHGAIIIASLEKELKSHVVSKRLQYTCAKSFLPAGILLILNIVIVLKLILLFFFCVV